MEGGVVTIRLDGELDAMTVGRFVAVRDEMLRQRPSSWILALSDLRMLDSSGVVAILYALRSLRDRGGEMMIEGATDQPLMILRHLRLDEVLGFAPRGDTKRARVETGAAKGEGGGDEPATALTGAG